MVNDSNLGVLSNEVLVGELGTIDRFATTAITSGEITTLKHEIWDNTVKEGSFVMKRLARFAHTLFTRAQRTKVFACLDIRSILQVPIQEEESEKGFFWI